MRVFNAFVAPFAVAALVQAGPIGNESSSTDTTSISIPPYSNPATAYLTQTNSLGVVTGQPTLPEGVTSIPTQAPVATIPAGLPPGVTWIALNISRSMTSFQVSVGSSTTVVLRGGGVASSVTTITATSGSGAKGSGTGSATTGTKTVSAVTASSNAANNVKLVSGGVLGFGAFFAALL